MTEQTPLYEQHLQCGGKMVDFAGWEMPLHYGSQLSEHRQVREGAGMFDVSHMTVIDVAGPARVDYLRRVVANDVARLAAAGDALYGVLLNESGGVVDDLIVYRRTDDYRLVVNAATREKVLAWLAQQNDEQVVLRERDLALIAVQGPEAVERFVEVTSKAVPVDPFTAVERGDWLVARTGYTGEDGVEVMLPADAAVELWGALAAAGVQPAGLGARDTLRLEAGLNLYGQDMDAHTSPLISNLAWTVSWEPDDRSFIGRQALTAQRTEGPVSKLTGLVLETKGVMRHGHSVYTDTGPGVVTSGIFSPTLGHSIALARLPRAASGMCEVEVRGKRLPARIVRPPFVRKGKRVYE
jgi:aminomethyltransferase